MENRKLRLPEELLLNGEVLESGENGSWERQDVCITLREEPDWLAVRVRAAQTPVRMVELRWHLQEPWQGKLLGDAWERTYGDAAWRSADEPCLCPWYLLHQDGEKITGYGVRVRPNAICAWLVTPQALCLQLDLRCGGEGVCLNGRELLAAEIVCCAYPGLRPFAAAQQFCRALCSDPILPPAPVYGTNNWYYAYGRISAEQVLAEADQLAELTRGIANRPYLVIDDGWQAERYHEDGSFEEVYNGGPWIPNQGFAQMQRLTEQLRQRDILPGILIRPLQDERSHFPESWRLSHNRALDPSVPEVETYVRGLIRQLGDWGFRLVKHDFTTFDLFNRWGWQMPEVMAGEGWHFADRSRTTAEIVKGLYRAILEEAQACDMLVLGCNTIGHLAAGLEHLQRTGNDTSGLYWEDTVHNGVNTLAFRMPQHRAFFDIDADCIGITAHIPWEKNRLWGELLAHSGTSLFYSLEPNTAPEQQKQELAELLRSNAEPMPPAEPLDWQENPYPKAWRISEEELVFPWETESVGGTRGAQT